MMRHPRLFPLLAAIAATAASAQQITLYEHDNFGGRTISATNTVQNLQNTGFNDLASSAVVRGGNWQVCSDAYFRGNCVTLGPGNYTSLRAMGMNDRISSVREVSWGGGGVGGGADGAIVLYDGNNFTGRPFSLNGRVDNLASAGFNDRAQSAEVRSGTWQLCVDSDFRGRCAELAPGRYPNLDMLSNRVSSARIVGADSAGTGGGWGRGHARVVLYEGPDFHGRTFTINSNYVANLGNTGFNDRASSLRVERGYWIFCSDANFQGECRTLGPGDYASLPYGLNNRVSSARRISEDYPYSGPPNWHDGRG